MTNEYQEVLAALERRAILTEIQPLLHSLANSSTGINAGIDFVDAFGLTICMRAAAHGRLRVVKAAHELGARIEKRNPFTGANLLHYAVQQRVGGAGIVNWAVCNTSEKNS